MVSRHPALAVRQTVPGIDRGLPLKNGHCAFLQRRLIKDIGLTCSRFMGPRIFTSESLRTESFKDHLRTVYR
jgi:hypothetical protein